MYKKMALEEDWLIMQVTDGENMLSEDIIAKNIIVELARKGFPLDDMRLF